MRNLISQALAPKGVAPLSAHAGIQPQGTECLPHPEFLAWHRAEVFKEPARE